MQVPSPTLAAFDVRWLDILGLAIVLYFTLVGARRGLWWQLVRLLGVVAAVAVARALAPRIAPRFAASFPDISERLAGGIVWTIVIVLGLLIVALVGRIGKDTVDSAELGLVDRIGGAVSGALTGALVHAGLVLCLCQTAAHDWSVAAVRGTTSQRLVDTLGRKLPLFLDAHAADTLQPWLDRTHDAR